MYRFIDFERYVMDFFFQFGVFEIIEERRYSLSQNGVVFEEFNFL